MRSAVFLLLALTAMVGLAVGSGGFTSVSADRTTEVAVVEDDSAYLGVADEVERCGLNDAVVNRFPGTTLDTISVEAAIPTGETGELRIGPRGSTEQIGPGESTRFELDDSLSTGDSAEIQVKPPAGNVSSAETLVFEQIQTSGGGVEVAVDDRTVDVGCSEK